MATIETEVTRETNRKYAPKQDILFESAMELYEKNKEELDVYAASYFGIGTSQEIIDIYNDIKAKLQEGFKLAEESLQTKTTENNKLNPEQVVELKKNINDDPRIKPINDVFEKRADKRDLEIKNIRNLNSGLIFSSYYDKKGLEDKLSSDRTKVRRATAQKASSEHNNSLNAKEKQIAEQNAKIKAQQQEIAKLKSEKSAVSLRPEYQRAKATGKTGRSARNVRRKR